MTRASFRRSRIAIFVAVTACTRDAGTAARLEDALARTFANLVHTQQSLFGTASIEASALRAAASCHLASDGAALGGGWLCTVTWFVPGHHEPIRDLYEVSLTPDGCYTATADGAEAHVGGPTAKSRGGDRIVNILYTFDGCFDPTRPVAP